MFNQRVRRALDRSADAAATQQPARQRGLAGAEFALKRDQHAAFEQRAEARPEPFGGSGVSKMNGQR